MSRPVILGIAGCSGSGKTTLAQELARELEGTHLHLDHYYRDLSHLTYEQRCQQNFDHPDALELPLLLSHLRELAAGRSVELPQYDFTTHTRKPGITEHIFERHLLLVDGIFALHYDNLRPLYDLSIYVDTPDEVCYGRRLARDVRERGRSPEVVAAHYADTVRPMAEKYVRPSAQYADVIADGTSSLDWSIEQVLSALRKRGLLKLLEAGMNSYLGHM
ncbi:uridine kinase [Acidipila rosea]|uniref:uridine/cytidine kinase n=1 Tax=Acidipila rosea TaxID=768535 RepID=A0A4R1KZ03_9BACT|nr:uridine kinase [Acidipila rosea]TCK70785.1 uridine kinase [Acidipila rosea]